MKRIIKIVIVCLIVVGLGIGIYLGIKKVIDSANKVNEKYDKDVELLQTNYDNFNSYLSDYNDARIDLATLLESAIYYEDYPSVSESIANFYLEYDELINNIIISVKNMDKACKRSYMEVDYNEMCASYKNTYEKIVNVFLNDIDTYNELIINYHEWAKKEDYQVFTSKYITDYIDYNEDGIYEGKAEVNEEE